MTTPVSAPPPVTTPPIRSRRTKFLLAGVVVAAVLVGLAAAIFGFGSRAPSTKALREFVASSLAAQNQPLAIAKFDRSYKGDGDSGQALFAGEVELTEPRYVRVETAAYLQSEYGVALPALQADLALLKSRLAGRVRDVVGSAPPSPALGELVLVKQPMRVGTRLRLSGSVRAARIGSLWQFDLVSLQVTPTPSAGEKRPTGPAVYDVSDLAEQAKLRQLVTSTVDYATKIKAARPRLEAEIQKDREERTGLFAQLMRTGALWLGTATGAQGETDKLVLETTECSAKNGTVSAVLRNDGGWSDARGFVGQWNLDDTGERCHVLLQTRPSQRIEGAGPLLETNDTLTLEGDLTAAGVFEAKTPRWQFRFQRVTEAEQAATRTQLMEPLTTVLAAAAPTTLYHGAAISKRTHVSEPVLLRFDQQDADGSLIVATLQSAAHDAWKRRFQGTIVVSRFRTGDAPLRLRSESVDRSDDAARDSVLGISDRIAAAFKLDGNRLTGEDDTFTFRLERAEAAWLATYNAERKARGARFLNLVKAGAAYDGVGRDDRGMVARLRMRILEVDAQDNIVSASFDSRDQAGVYHRMSGSFDVTTGVLQLGSSGVARSDSAGVMRIPIFTSASPQRITLRLEDDALTGKIENQGWALTFALTAAAAPLPESDLPTVPGAYALVDGRWQALPRNNGHTVYAAAQVLGGVLNALHAWDSRIPAGQQDTSDQAATLVFEGNVAAPSVNRDAVIIAYIGDIVPPAAALRQKYAELRDYPTIEMARTQPTRDGKREATLLKIAPGFSGFGNTRIAAVLEQPRANATVLRSTGPLDPGPYAVTVGSAAFEVGVR